MESGEREYVELIDTEEEFIVEEIIDDGKLLSCGDEKTQELLKHA